MDPKATVGWIYKEDLYALPHTKKESSGPKSEKKIFFYIFPIESYGS